MLDGAHRGLQQLPERLVLQQVRYTIVPDGVRTEKVVLVTALLDPDQYPASELAAQLLIIRLVWFRPRPPTAPSVRAAEIAPW